MGQTVHKEQEQEQSVSRSLQRTEGEGCDRVFRRTGAECSGQEDRGPGGKLTACSRDRQVARMLGAEQARGTPVDHRKLCHPGKMSAVGNHCRGWLHQ